MIIKNESERKSCMDILESDPDAELREGITKKMNGIYSFQICKNCKAYWANFEGNIATARIVENCKRCPNEFELKKG